MERSLPPIAAICVQKEGKVSMYWYSVAIGTPSARTAAAFRVDTRPLEKGSRLEAFASVKGVAMGTKSQQGHSV